MIWTVPPTATIINNINDTTIYIDFANESGTIFLLSSCGDTLDSLFVFVEKEINFSLGNDTLLCHGNSFYLTPGTGFNSYLWQDGSTESTFLVSESGEYWVRVENSCGIASDTIKIEFNQPLDIDLGNDTSFCYGQSVLLSPGGEYYSYFWQDGSTDSILQAGLTGYYWVIVTDSVGCSATDSIYIEANMEFGFSLGPDTSIICDGDYIFLHGPQGYESYLWQDGSNYLDFLADTAGFYWLEVTDTNSCVARDSLKLTVNKVEGFLGPDTSMCEAGSFTLRTNPKYESYFWFDGSNDSVYRVSEKGKYWVTVIDSMGCTGTDTLNLDYFPALMLTINSNGYLCEDDSVLLEAISNCNNYLWQDGSQNSTFIAKDSGTYWVRVTNPCETKSDTIVLDACSSIWIPNVFTPNNDGYNDYFYAIGKNIPKFKMEIFNRWGQTLKVLYSLNEKWDGTYRGHKAAEGTYFWVADYEQVNWDGSIHHIRQRGSVTLLR